MEAGRRYGSQAKRQKKNGRHHGGQAGNAATKVIPSIALSFSSL